MVLDKIKFHVLNIIWFIALAIHSFIVWLIFLRYNYNIIPQKSFDSVLDSGMTAALSHRLLVPFLSHGLSSLLPEFLKSFLEQCYQGIVHLALQAGASQSSFQTKYQVEHCLALMAMPLLILISAYFFYLLAKKSFQITLIHFLAPFLFLSFLPLLMHAQYMNYYYDLVTVFLTVSILLAFSSNIFPMLGLLSICALFNKETFLVLVPLFGIWGFLKKEKRFYFLSLVLFVIGIFFHFYFLGQGAKLEFHLFDLNLPMITLGYSLQDLVFFFLACLALCSFWNEKPLLFRLWFLFFGIGFFLLQLLWGVMNERRIYYEVLPVFLLLMIFSVERLILRFKA